MVERGLDKPIAVNWFSCIASLRHCTYSRSSTLAQKRETMGVLRMACEATPVQNKVQSSRKPSLCSKGEPRTNADLVEEA